MSLRFPAHSETAIPLAASFDREQWARVAPKPSRSAEAGDASEADVEAMTRSPAVGPDEPIAMPCQSPLANCFRRPRSSIPHCGNLSRISSNPPIGSTNGGA
jgi:hypothetical protein